LFDIFDYIRRTEEPKKIAMVGDASTPWVHEHIKFYNPYTLRAKICLENMLITSDSQDKWVHQSRKFMAKIRENKENNLVYYKEFEGGDFERLQKTSLQYSFILGALLLGR
jgi:prolyl oligopeptidase PreP (S9A serine peptidase family)